MKCSTKIADVYLNKYKANWDQMKYSAQIAEIKLNVQNDIYLNKIKANWDQMKYSAQIIWIQKKLKKIKRTQNSPY